MFFTPQQVPFFGDHLVTVSGLVVYHIPLDVDVRVFAHCDIDTLVRSEVFNRCEQVSQDFTLGPLCAAGYNVGVEALSESVHGSAFLFKGHCVVDETFAQDKLVHGREEFWPGDLGVIGSDGDEIVVTFGTYAEFFTDFLVHGHQFDT